MRTNKLTRLLALLLALALVAAACGSTTDDAAEGEDAEVSEETDEGSEEEAMEDDGEEEAMEDDGEEEAMEDEDAGPVTISYGNAQEFSNYNNGLASSNSVKNSIVLNEVLPSPYNFAGPGGDLALNSELMDSVTVITADPQVIEYVINADAAWSDGEHVDCDDFYLTWSAYNGTQVQLDDAGEPVIDEETETPIPLFAVTGSTGYDVISGVECSEDGKTITTTYSEIFADWQASFSYLMPAHVVEAQAGVDDLIAAFDGGDNESIAALAEFFNNGWTVDPGTVDAATMPSAGPMTIASWEAGASLTLEPNAAYWGTPANGTVTFRYIAEEAQAQALANSEINAMDPQPTPDLLAQLEGTDGVVVETGSQFIWEHFDFNFANDALAIREVREAFALCLPREQIVANLIAPLDPTATVLNNRFNQQFEPAYTDASNGAYDSVDLEAAQALLDASGVAQPVDVRIGWFDNGGNARRTDQVALTIDSCNQIGFNIIDAGSETFFDVELAAGDWDIAMFAWAGSPLKTGSSEIYRTAGGINFGGYANAEVDALLDQINVTLDAAEQAEVANEVDALLWEDLVTIPVFGFPGVVAYSDNAENVIYNPSQNGLTFNASQWQLS